jgi:hypothetical protein
MVSSRYKFDPKKLADKIKTYDIVNLVNGRPEIGRIVHLTFFSSARFENRVSDLLSSALIKSVPLFFCA